MISRATKRLFDVALAGAVLLLASPLIALVALVIWLEDGGPLLFVQDRVGQDGRTFRCYKFRSMRPNAEARGLGGTVAADDDRVTRVGRLLRAWTLDELPQLWNIVRGDMSVVGPRPWIPAQAERCTGRARRRFDARPGLAGWAWIHGRNLVPWDERVQMDIWYVEHASLWLDFRILARAFVLLFRRQGVYGPGGVNHDTAWGGVGGAAAEGD